MRAVIDAVQANNHSTHAMLNDLIRTPLPFATPERLTDVSSWHGHIPFAFFAVASCRPRLLVELGTHRGDSYCAFCQAVQALNLPTACFAVDTWQGDTQSGHYGSEVLQELSAYHDARYASFSKLLPMTFDQAFDHFDDGTIDLLHIDGLHTYEAVRHDFETWLPKLSSRAVVLLHDIHVTTGDFGVYRLWRELVDRYPSFEFHHANGLGVVGVGDNVPEKVGDLFNLPHEAADGLRRLFRRLGEAITARLSTEELEQGLAAQKAYSVSLERRIEEVTANFNERGLYIQSLEERIEEMAGQHAQRGLHIQALEGRIEDLEKRLAEPLSARLRRMTMADIDHIKHRLLSGR